MKILLGNEVVPATIAIIVLLIGCAGTRPTSIGVTDGRLAPTSDRPNNVSSMTDDETHRIEPFTYATDKETAFDALLEVISVQDRATIVVQADDYLHVKFRSRIFRFVDDVEFYLPETGKIIRIRSAARLGHSDFGVNRKRVERLRSRFYEVLANR